MLEHEEELNLNIDVLLLVSPISLFSFSILLLF